MSESEGTEVRHNRNNNGGLPLNTFGLCIRRRTQPADPYITKRHDAAARKGRRGKTAKKPLPDWRGICKDEFQIEFVLTGDGYNERSLVYKIKEAKDRNIILYCNYWDPPRETYCIPLRSIPKNIRKGFEKSLDCYEGTAGLRDLADEDAFTRLFVKVENIINDLTPLHSWLGDIPNYRSPLESYYIDSGYLLGLKFAPYNRKTPTQKLLSPAQSEHYLKGNLPSGKGLQKLNIFDPQSESHWHMQVTPWENVDRT